MHPGRCDGIHALVPFAADAHAGEYKAQTGDSMEMPTKKQKRAIILVGVTGAVYLTFQYLLPLVTPFLVAYLIAMGIRPVAKWAKERLRLPEGMTAGLILLLCFGLILLCVYFCGCKFTEEAGKLLEHIPEYLQDFNRWMTGVLHNLERLFHIKRGVLVNLGSEMLRDLVDEVRLKLMPYLMDNTAVLFKGLVQVGAITVITVVAIILSVQEMDNLRRKKAQSVFRMEFALLTDRLINTGAAYCKTQLTIMAITTALCIVGMMLIKNPYYILAGVGIGLLDALPIFGTGTILLPWALICATQGKWTQAAVLAGLYAVCSIIREMLEPRLMGSRVGISAWETLIAMYVGLQLFGVLGFILGPIGLLIIEDIVQAYDG